jgi:hypothetical protein
MRRIAAAALPVIGQLIAGDLAQPVTTTLPRNDPGVAWHAPTPAGTALCDRRIAPGAAARSGTVAERSH